jgi:PAS domain S-box-containing protein
MTPRLLIVEDEIIIAKDLERHLTSWGYQVVGMATTSEEAVQLAVSLHPDLVLMDIRLNGEFDGIETTAQIYEHLDLPVIYLTAHTDANTLERAKLTHPLGYLTKPVDFPTLHASVEMGIYTYAISKRLAESELQYKTILNTAQDGFMLVEETSRISDANESICKLTGYTREELLALSLSDLEAAESPAEIEAHFAKLKAEGSGRFETRWHRKDGTHLDLEISATYFQAKHCLFVFAHDITEQKKNQERILHLNTDLLAKVEENTRLYAAEHSQRELAETLVKASESLATSLEADTVLDLILEQIGRVIKNDVCNIMLIDDDQNTRAVRSRGYDTFHADVFIETFIFPLSGLTIRKEIIKTGKALVVPDVSDDPRWAKAGAAWLRSYIAAPISVQKKVIGFINVGSSLPDVYNEQHAAHLQTFAHQAAVAFQNARFFEEAQANAQRLQSLSHQLINIQETERRYLARELHDEIGQALTALSLIIQGVQTLTNVELIQARLKESLAILNLALQQVRKISLDLHPSLLDDLGLVPALRWFADRESKWGNFQVKVLAKEIKNLPEDLQLVCFRITQEALTNISRHAKADNVAIQLWKRKGDLHLAIRDDGQGFNVQEALENAIQGRSLGLLGMRERVMLVGGEIEINSFAKDGTEIHARLPLGNSK